MSDHSEEEPDGFGEAERPCKIVVSNLPPSAETDDVQGYFESSKRTGGGPIANIDYDEERHTAVIEFQDPDTVDSVLQRQPIKMSKFELEVNIYTETADDESCSSGTTDAETQNKILVANIPDDFEKEDLEMFFENEKRTGGGPIANIEHNEEEGTAIIEFMDPDTVGSVLAFAETSQIRLSGTPLEVQIYSGNTAGLHEDLDKIAIFNLPEGADDEYIETFFENRRRPFAGTVSSVDIDNDQNRAIVQFESIDTVDMIMEHLPISMMKKELDIQRFNARTWQGSASENSEQSGELPTSVLLQNLPSDTTEELLELYFENPKHGGAIKGIEYVFGSGRAVIEFEEHKPVEQLLNKQPVKFRGATVDITPYVPIPVKFDTIEVRGPSRIVTEENMEMYFENPSRSGGCDIESIDINEGGEENVAYIVFSSEEVAKAVAERDHLLMRCPLVVTLHDPSQVETDVTADEEKTDGTQCTEFGTPDEPNTLVKVKGVKKFSSPDPVRFYFENKRKSGGGTILDFSMCEDKDEALITFESSDDAKAVTERQHAIGTQELAVSMFTPPAQRPCYTKSLLVKGIGSDTTQDCLLNFLEAKSGVTPVRFMYGEDEGIKLVTFDAEPDAEKLQKGCDRTPLEGRHLTVCKVPISNCIKVSRLDESIQTYTIELYFENSNRSGGGAVEKVEMKEGYCLVYFENHEDVDRVLKKDHNLSGEKIEVTLFYECLGKDQGEGFQPIFSCPGDISREIEREKLSFLLKSNTCREMIENKMTETHASLTWPKDLQGNRQVTIKCLLTEDVEKGYGLSKSWEERVQKAFEALLDDITVKSIPVPNEIWSRVKESLGKVQINDPRMVMLSLSSDAKTITVIGEIKSTEELSCTITEIIRKTECDYQTEKNTKSEHITLDEIKIKASIAANLKETVESQIKKVKISIDQKKNKVIITGQEENVGKAGMMVYQKTGEYVCSSVPMSADALFLLQRKTVEQYLTQEWGKAKIAAVWKPGDRTVDLCVTQGKNLNECIAVLKRCFHEHEISLDETTICLPNSEKWKKMITSLEADLMKKFVISVSDSLPKIIFCCTADVKEDVLSALSRFLSVNTVITEEIGIPSDVAKFVSKHLNKRIASIAKLHQDEFVKIHIDKENRISISGNKNGIMKAKQQIQDLASKVQMQKLKLSKPGLAIHIKTPDGKDILSNIERDLPCMIECEGQKQKKGQDTTKAKTTESFLLEGGRVINLYQGDITDLPVDALICAADKKLKLAAGLGKVIVTKGGVDIKNDCKKFLHNNKELQEGHVLVATSESLCCQRVFFVNGPEWKGGSQKEIHRLEDVVMATLQCTTKENSTSVAFPAICCGKSGFPMERGTKTIVEALKKYFKDNPRAPVRQVYLADINQPTVDKFSEASKEVFWKAQHFISQEPTATSKPKTQNKPLATVKVVKGHLAKQKVDVIVNTTGNKLDLMKGSVSTSIIKAAGTEMQAEIAKEYPKGIVEGQLAYSKGYKLKCDMVMHTSLYEWANTKALETMKEAMKECLVEAHRRDFTSIAFPVFGTGSLGYPPESVSKAMFETVQSVVEKLPDFRVNDIRFVIYEKDTSIIQVFEEEQKRWKGKLLPDSNELSDNESDEDDAFDIVMAPGVYNIGSMVLEVKTGDLTKESCDCIVNSTDTHLDMTRGAVAKALLKRAGPRLEEELKTKRAEMRKNRIIMTEGYDTSCDKIIHVDAQYSADEWKEMMLKCLRYAEDNSLSSIAFPAIGSGFGMKTEDMATLVFTAITDFQANKPVHLHEVRFVLYNEKMFTEFCDIVDIALENKTRGIFSSLWSGLKNMFSTAAQPKASVVKRKRKRAEDIVNLAIYAMSDTVINDVNQRLKTLCEKIMYKKTIDRSIIKRLEESQINDIEMVCQKHHVSLNLKIEDGLIELDGIKENAYEAVDRIYDILRDADREEYSNYMAETTAVVIQWFYIDNSSGEQKLCKYDPKSNGDIEDSYKAVEERMEIIMKSEDGSDNVHVLDFMLMQQYVLQNPEAKTPIIRRDLLRESSCSAPEHWAPTQEPLSVQPLANTDKDFQQISEMFMDSSGGGYTIVEIKRIQNMHLWQQYQTKKKQLDQQNPKTTVNERTLWHGTKSDAVGSINQHGFNRSFCGANAAAFGDGVYFATKAVTACNNTYAVEDTDGTKNVYYCHVLTGEFTKGKQGARTPPPKPSGGPAANYDSLADDETANPSVFIIFNDTQAYPEYLISFKRSV